MRLSWCKHNYLSYERGKTFMAKENWKHIFCKLFWVFYKYGFSVLGPFNVLLVCRILLDFVTYGKVKWCTWTSSWSLRRNLGAHSLGSSAIAFWANVSELSESIVKYLQVNNYKSLRFNWINQQRILSYQCGEYELFNFLIKLNYFKKFLYPSKGKNF